MNILIDKILDSVKKRDKDFYTKEQVIETIEAFKVKENVIYPSIYHPDITIDNFCISPQKHLFTYNGISHYLNKKQFGLMYLLMDNKDRLVSNKELLQTVWGVNCTNNTNLNWYISGIKKVTPNNIFNVKGKGYIWRSKHQ